MLKRKKFHCGVIDHLSTYTVGWYEKMRPRKIEAKRPIKKLIAKTEKVHE